MTVLDTQYNPGVQNSGAKYDINKLDTTGATSGEAPIFNGTAVEWTTPAVSPGAIALTDAHILVGNASNDATDVAVSGDISITNLGVVDITGGAIVNADVNASAAIDFSKLATLSSANILVGSAGNVATSVAVTGDVTISNAGVTAIAGGVIVNADVNGSAAIDFSKLATLTSGNILVGSAGNVATSVAMSGNATISNAGVVTVVGATGAFEAGGAITNAGGTLAVGFIPTAVTSPQALSGPGAANITTYQTQYTSTGAGDVVTLADATRIGHLKKISYVAEGAGGDTCVVTPANLEAFTTATLSAIGDYVLLMWNGANWLVIEAVGATLA